MHISDVSVGVMPANAIVGGNVPIAAGSALAFKLRSSRRIAVSFFGDGATNQGAWHEALNLAAVLELPVIFACVNNQFASSTSLEKSVKIERLSDRATAYGMPGAVVDGMDVLAVREATAEAVERARAGSGPTLLEYICYRLVGHSRSDPANYRAQEEFEHWRKRDPLVVTRAKLIESGVIDEKGIQLLEEDIKMRIEQITDEADQFPDPDPEQCLDDVYA
jgi:TPP-dependent pyruvate/acetoin dehydrogenase alpha subunit